MERIKNDLWLIIATLEETGLHHRNDTEKIADICLRMLGARKLCPFFNIPVSRDGAKIELKKYIYNHKY